MSQLNIFSNQIVTIQADNAMYLIQSTNCALTSHGSQSCSGNNVVFTSSTYNGQLNYRWHIHSASFLNSKGISQNGFFLINLSSSPDLANLYLPQNLMSLCQSGHCPASSDTKQYNTICIYPSIITSGLPDSFFWSFIELSNSKYAIKSLSNDNYLSRCTNCLNGSIDQPVVDDNSTDNLTTHFNITLATEAIPSTNQPQNILYIIGLAPLNKLGLPTIIILSIIGLLIIGLIIWLIIWLMKKYHKNKPVTWTMSPVPIDVNKSSTITSEISPSTSPPSTSIPSTSPPSTSPPSTSIPSTSPPSTSPPSTSPPSTSPPSTSPPSSTLEISK